MLIAGGCPVNVKIKIKFCCLILNLYICICPFCSAVWAAAGSTPYYKNENIMEYRNATTRLAALFASAVVITGCASQKNYDRRPDNRAPKAIAPDIRYVKRCHGGRNGACLSCRRSVLCGAVMALTLCKNVCVCLAR